jgi:hypothetical protein
MSIVRDYTLMTPDEVRQYIPDMQALGVSKVARTSAGFTGQYLLNGASILDRNPQGSQITWRRTRSNFIYRHMQQYKQNPTKRRKLALIAWAYMPRNVKM